MFGLTAHAGSSCGFALEGRRVHAFNEEAFRYLLDIQRRRSERAHQAFLLVLIDVKDGPATGARLAPAIAQRLFASLGRSFRETDLIGWYRQDRIAGAVLIERGADAPRGGVPASITARVHDALARGLDAGVARRLRVRVCQVHSHGETPCISESGHAGEDTRPEPSHETATR